jgi:hypothetical protein
MGGLLSKVADFIRNVVDRTKKIIKRIPKRQSIPPQSASEVVSLIISTDTPFYVAGCAIAVPVIVWLVGFTPAGVTACEYFRFHQFSKSTFYILTLWEVSPAAAWHASIGNVVAGSLFASLQSLGTAPHLLVVIGGLIGAAGCFIHSLLETFLGWGR